MTTKRHKKFQPRSNGVRNGGTAEIELILIIAILVTLMLLAVGAMKIAAARMSTGGSAGYQAFHDSTDSSTPPASDDTPITGFASVRPSPELPNRVDEPNIKAPPITLSTGYGSQPLTVSVGAKAAVISPAWTYSSYPVGEADQQILSKWFTDYIDESHNGLNDTLGLASEWKP